MSLLGTTILPGKHGKVFTTNAKHDDHLFEIHEFLSNYDGISQVEIDKKSFPVKIKVLTDKIVDVEQLKKDFKKTGFHLIDENLFR